MCVCASVCWWTSGFIPAWSLKNSLTGYLFRCSTLFTTRRLCQTPCKWTSWKLVLWGLCTNIQTILTHRILMYICTHACTIGVQCAYCWLYCRHWTEMEVVCFKSPVVNEESEWTWIQIHIWICMLFQLLLNMAVTSSWCMNAAVIINIAKVSCLSDL